MHQKITIYQVFTRLLGNRNTTRKPNGTLAENGVGKMNDLDVACLRKIRAMGFSHIWFTGIIRHATATDYTAYGLPRQHAEVVKGLAGSPYAIADYYDVDPDLAVDVEHRMDEFHALVARAHSAGLKVIIDFVPNHVAREYHSVCLPDGVRDLGQDDDASKAFDAQNNFYYCPGQTLVLPVKPQEGSDPYVEMPAKCTGNDHFDPRPGVNDWYETVKLNYGVDYLGGHVNHFDPMPSTWKKMTDILLFWAGQGIDGFRCDMAEMVPQEFWCHATTEVKHRFPKLIFIGEVYNPAQYRTYIAAGFDYLYDKVGMYDCLRGIVCGQRSATDITSCWQSTDDIRNHMLYFLENHDEQRIGSDFFCGDGRKALPAVVVASMIGQNPFMVYFGQEVGEHGMDAEGFSGRDGRTTIFDYWMVDKVRREYFAPRQLTRDERQLHSSYRDILHIATHERAVTDGEMFDLEYVNPLSSQFNPQCDFAFLRKYDSEVLLIAVNFSDKPTHLGIVIPTHAFDCLHLQEKTVEATDLLTHNIYSLALKKDEAVHVDLQPYGAKILKFNMNMEDNGYVLNEHDKEEFPPAHTAEHLLNQVMVRMFGCERSRNAHIERKKSKITYTLDHKPSRKEENAIADRMNELIAADLPVTYEYVDRDHVPEGVSLDRLPADASETIRLVRIGDFDVCPCIGKHVRSTSQIGKFVMLGTNWDEKTHSFRIRFKVVP